MDDFGTGYSSLSNLQAFPFDKIKIDGSFIKAVDANEQAATIVRAVLGIGRGLKLPVLAEGVETDEELGFLGAELCDQIQGYLLGKPEGIAKLTSVTSCMPRKEYAISNFPYPISMGALRSKSSVDESTGSTEAEAPSRRERGDRGSLHGRGLSSNGCSQRNVGPGGCAPRNQRQTPSKGDTRRRVFSR
jgi:EAL domain